MKTYTFVVGSQTVRIQSKENKGRCRAALAFIYGVPIELVL